MAQAAKARVEGWEDAWLNSAGNVYLFATGVLGIMPHDPELTKLSKADFSKRFGPEAVMLEQWQDEFLREFHDSPRHSVTAGHGVGKGVVLAILALWFPLTHFDSKTVVTANSQDQLRDNNWPEIKKWHRRLPEPLREQLKIEEERAFIRAAPEMAFVVRRTASKGNPEALQGIHAAHVLYLVDEASGIAEIIFEVAQGSLSTDGAIACLFSNPTKTSGFFHATHHRLRHLWKTRRVSSEDVPRARGHIEGIIELYGKDSNKYRVRVEGKFPTQDDEVVIGLALMETARGREVAINNVYPIWGVDVARFGDDASALVKRQGNALIGGPKEWHQKDGAQVAGLIIAEFNATPIDDRPKEIIVDIIGVGASVYDILRLPGSPVQSLVRGCNVAESTAISETEHRLRDELWFKGRAWFQEKTCRLPAIIDLHGDEQRKSVEKLIAELSQPTYDYTSLGKRIVESKSDLKKRGVPSPNLADAFLLTLAGGIYPRSNPHQPYRPVSSGSAWTA